MVAEPQAAAVVVVANPPQMAPEVVGVAPQTVAGVAPATVADVNDSQKKNNRIQVSNTKKPLFFYLNLAKRYIKQHNYVELSALGMAIPTAVTISEILKANGVAVERKVLTSTVGAKDENKGRLVQKAKLEILLERSEKSMNQQKTVSEAESKTKSEAKTETAGTEVKKAESMTASNASESKAETKAVEATASKTEELVAQPN